MNSKGAKRTEAKLFLNNLYGKLASSSNSSFKVAYVKEDESIGFYIVPAIRIISNNNIEVAIKGGVGVEIEPYRGVAYIAPSSRE